MALENKIVLSISFYFTVAVIESRFPLCALAGILSIPLARLVLRRYDLYKCGMARAGTLLGALRAPRCWIYLLKLFCMA